MRVKAGLVGGFLILNSGSVFAQDILSCSKIESDAARLECYDQVAGRVERALSEDVKGTATVRIKEREESIKSAAIGDYDVADQEYDGFSIKNITLNNQRRPVYHSDDGRFFQQVSGIAPMAQLGDKVELEQGFLGSLFLVTEKGARFKVKEL
jgi:hypothetical protein